MRPCSLIQDGGGTRLFRNVGYHLQKYKVYTISSFIPQNAINALVTDKINFKGYDRFSHASRIGLVVRGRGYRSRGPAFYSRRFQIFWEIVGLERGPLNLVTTIEELLGRNSSGSGLENREYGRGDPLRWPRDTLYPQKLALTSLTSGDRSVGIVRLRPKAKEFVFPELFLMLRY
jgi:hypothetical protein